MNTFVNLTKQAWEVLMKTRSQFSEEWRRRKLEMGAKRPIVCLIQQEITMFACPTICMLQIKKISTQGLRKSLSHL